MTLPGTSIAPPIAWIAAIRSATVGSAMTASSRLVHGPSATTVGELGLSFTARVRSVAASSVLPVLCCGGITIHPPPSALSRHSSGKRRPSGPGSTRPQANGIAPAPNSSSTYWTIRRPEAQLVMAVPVGAMVTARTSTLGSRSSTASAARSLTSTSVSTMIGTRTVGGSPVTSGASVASVEPPHAPGTTARTATRTAPARARQDGMRCMVGPRRAGGTHQRFSRRASRDRTPGRATGRSSGPSDLFERLQRPVDLARGVVVDQPDPQHAPDLRLAESLDESGRVEVAVPHVDALAPERFRGRARPDALDGQRHGRHALRAAARVGDAVDRHAGDGAEPLDEPSDELALVVDDRGHSRDELAPALARFGGTRRAGNVAVRAPDVAQVVG